MTQPEWVVVTRIEETYKFGNRDTLRIALEGAGITYKDFPKPDGSVQRAWATSEVEANLPKIRELYAEAKKPRGRPSNEGPRGRSTPGYQSCERMLNAIIRHFSIEVL